MIKGPAILLFRGTGILSALIRFQTRGAYAHAAFLLPDGQILEAWHKGVRIRPLKRWDGVDAFFVIGMTAEQWAIALDYAKAQLGKKYDFIAIVRFISRNKMPDAGNDKWFCSELIYDSLLTAHVHLFSRIAGWAVSPGFMSFSPLLAPLLPITETSEVSEEREVTPEPLPEPSPAPEEAPVVK